ncbi:MAG: hypothetical protein HKN47_10670 [Pirellulaceae bacterium]|nr:hypothetical protein [Pirellulaceae bacterium]
MQQKFESQSFDNAYVLIDGVAMQREYGAQFQIPHPVLKRHLSVGHFVELRIDSPRFSMHPDAAAGCTCPSCDGQMSKPILRHEHPATLLPLPPQDVPARGWGEDFWVQINSRDGDLYCGRVDNPLVESRLHSIRSGDEIIFRSDQILAVHSVHRRELVMSMDPRELKELAQWLATQNDPSQ